MSPKLYTSHVNCTINQMADGKLKFTVDLLYAAMLESDCESNVGCLKNFWSQSAFLPTNKWCMFEKSLFLAVY